MLAYAARRYSFARATSDHHTCVLVGYCHTSRAPDGTEIDVSPPGEPSVTVTGINNQGWIIGSYAQTNQPLQGFVQKP